MNEKVYGENDEVFNHETLKEALEIVWDSCYDLPDIEIFTVYEGVLGDYCQDNMSCKVVNNIKERKFKEIRQAKYFYMENFKEITTN